MQVDRFKHLSEAEDISLSEQITRDATSAIAEMKRQKDEALRQRDLMIIAATADKDGATLDLYRHHLYNPGQYVIESWEDIAENAVRFRAVRRAER